jgi:hypothetical protein
VNLAWESGSASLAFEEGAHPIVASTWYSPEYGRRAPTFAVSVEEELALPVVRRVTLNW